jgi:bifunctional non-homologous end joining protein LigD
VIELVIRMTIEEYNKKRDFGQTPEPSGKIKKTKNKTIFVVQKHDASHLHYDFRIEVDGVLKSWAVPKGPSPKTADKRLAMPTEDHPLAYASFEGTIPEGNYGAGRVIVWDAGTYKSIKEEPLTKSLENGRIEIGLEGKKMKGMYALIKIKARGKYGKSNKVPWLLFKMKGDKYVDKNYPLGEKSVKSGKTIEQIGGRKKLKRK